MPAEGRVCMLTEVYDSKEFMEKLGSRDDETAARFYKISQKTGNHLHSLGVLHRKKRWGRGDRLEPRLGTMHFEWIRTADVLGDRLVRFGGPMEVGNVNADSLPTVGTDSRAWA